MRGRSAFERIRRGATPGRRSLALAALVGAGLYVAAGGAADTSLLTYAQLDRGVLTTAGKDSPAHSLAHPWTGSSPEWETDLEAVAPGPGEADLRLEALGLLAQDTPQSSQPALADEPSAPAAPLSDVSAPPVAPHPAPEASPPPATQAAPISQAAAPPPPKPKTPPPTATLQPAPSAPAAGLSSLERQLFDGQNAERARSGLAPLQLDSGLQAVASRRAGDMATRGYFSHASPTGETAFTLIDAAGINAPYAAENIGFNNYPDGQSAAAVLSAFMASPSHRANILNGRYARVGVAVAVAAGGIKYYAVVFAGP